MNRLNKLFYARDASIVARNLLGKILIRKIGRTTISGKIVERKLTMAAKTLLPEHIRVTTILQN